MDNEENKQNIPTRQIILDQEEGEIMWPSPSAEQDLLWDELYNMVNDQDLSREIKWFSVSDNVRKYLSSKEISDKIQKIGKKFNLDSYQISELSKNIKYVFIKEILLADFITKIAEELKIEKKLANQMGQDVKNEIFVPQKEYLLKLYPPASAPLSGAEAGKPSIVPLSSEAKDGRGKIMEGKPNVYFKPPIFKKEAESVHEIVVSKITKKPIIKKEEPPIKFKVAPDTPAHLSQGVSLDHLYEKLKSSFAKASEDKSAKEERKEFLEEVIAKKEEELPKSWQIESRKHENTETRKHKSMETLKHENIETRKHESAENQIIKPKEIVKKLSDTKAVESKPPIRTMKGDITKTQKQ